MRNHILIFTFAFFLVPLALTRPAWSLPPAKQCLSELSPLVKAKNKILQNGGMWSLFERFKSLRPESTVGLQLDSKIQNLVWLLDYLCNTIEGVPLNDLAIYLTENLNQKSENEFRKELIILGKTHKLIDVWFEYAHNAQNNRTRKLDFKLIRLTIQNAQPLVRKYQRLGEHIEQSPDHKQIQSAEDLIRRIEELQTSDSYLSQAIEETAQVPYWDFDENHGGS